MPHFKRKSFKRSALEEGFRLETFSFGKSEVVDMDIVD
jgi:hypothetical protein